MFAAQARFRHLFIVHLLTIVVLIVTAMVPATPATTAPTAPDGNNGATEPAQFFWTRSYLPLVIGPEAPPPEPARPAIQLWFTMAREIRAGDDLAVKVTLRNVGSAAASSVRLIVPYDGDRFRLAYANLDRDRGDWIRADNFDRDFTVEFGRVQRNETRSGTLFLRINSNLQPGDQVRVRGRFTNGECGNPECQSNETRVRVVSTVGPEGGTEIGLGSGPSGTSFDFRPDGYIPGERVTTWLNLPGGGVQPLDLTAKADDNGRVSFRFDSTGLNRGFYSLVAHGVTSEREVVGRFEITTDAAAALASQPAATLPAGLSLIALPPAPLLDDPATAATPAQPIENSGAIQGVVAGDAAGTLRLPGVLVQVVDPSSGAILGSTSSDTFGGYLITGLPAGSFDVVFEPGFSYDSTAAQFLDGVLSGIAVTANATTSGQDIVLTQGITVRGQVRSADSAGLEDVSVLLLDPARNVVAAATTDFDGSYEIPGVRPNSADPTDTYIFVFDPREAAAPETTIYQEAEVTTRVSTATAVVDQILLRDPTLNLIEGQVLANDIRRGLNDVFVVIYEEIGGEYVYHSVTRTDVDGSYASDPLPNGSYKLEFRPAFTDDPTTRFYIDEYYNNAATLAAATPLTLAGGEIRDRVNAVLERGPAISGVVTAADSGAGLADVFVFAVDTRGNTDPTDDQFGFALTAADGSYTTSALRPGTYTVFFLTLFAADPTTAGYIGITRSEPVAIATTPLTGIDAVLSPGGGISGVVTAGDSGAALPDVLVLAIDDSGELAELAVTDANGAYSIGGLAAGNYRIEFFTLLSTGPARAYFTEFYNDSADLASADPVAVSVGAVTPDISATLARGGQISGRVSDFSRVAGLEGVVVFIYDSSGAITGFGISNINGEYISSALPLDASYIVEFDPTFSTDLAGYTIVYYDGQPTLELATPVPVTSAAPLVENISAILTRP